MNTTESNNKNVSNVSNSQAFKAACIGACENIVAQIGQVRDNIVAEFKGVQQSLVQRAIVEADALAWQTEYPHLIFPLLATEKVQTILQWQSRQQLFLRRLSPAYALAA